MNKDQFIVEKLNIILPAVPCLDTPEGFFWLWDKMQKHEKWAEFWQGRATFNLVLSLINPTRFRDAVAEFFGWEEEKCR